jgi:hypothetical protein
MHYLKKHSRKNKVVSLIVVGITICALAFAPLSTGAQSGGLFFDPNAPATSNSNTNYNSNTDYTAGTDYTSTTDYGGTTIFNSTGSYDSSVIYDPTTGTYTPSASYGATGTAPTTTSAGYQDRVTGFANRDPIPISCDKNFDTIGGMMDYAGCLIAKSIIPLLMSLAVMVFVYGVVKYVIAGDGSDDREEGRWFMIYGIFGLFAMVSVWGLVILLANTVGIGTAFPQF